MQVVHPGLALLAEHLAAVRPAVVRRVAAHVRAVLAVRVPAALVLPVAEAVLRVPAESITPVWR